MYYQIIRRQFQVSANVEKFHLKFYFALQFIQTPSRDIPAVTMFQFLFKSSINLAIKNLKKSKNLNLIKTSSPP